MNLLYPEFINYLIFHKLHYISQYNVGFIKIYIFIQIKCKMLCKSEK